jgi:hypothetical protein
MRVAVACALMLTLGAESARAATPRSGDDCRGPSIVLEPALSHRRSWREAAGDTQKRVAELVDVDACTRLDVEQAGGAVRVRASAADGRSVVRDLSGPSELEPTVVALLVLPPVERGDALGAPGDDDARDSSANDAKARAPKGKQAQPEAPKTQPVPAASGRDQPAVALGTTNHDAERTRGFELALGGSGRAAGYLFGPGVSAIVDWQFGRWLLGATVHGEQVSGSSASPSHYSAARSASLGALFGRRLVARPFLLDAAVELPIVAVGAAKWTSQQAVTQPVTENEPGEVGTDDDAQTASTTRTQTQSTPLTADLRAGALVRGVVPFAGRFGATLSADAEHSLGLLKPAVVSGQPASLGWNVGVSLGLFWSAP